MGVIVLVLRDRFEHALDVMQGQIAIAGVGERLDDGRRAHVVDEGLDQFHASDSLRVAGWSGLRCGRQAMRYRPGNTSSVSSVDERMPQIGRASCRERVCQYVKITGVAVPFKKKTETTT